MKEKILWITQTAVFIALVVVLQALTSALGNTIVTGSIVNLMLITSVMTIGLPAGLTVAVFSPVLAKFIGIGPLWSLIPFIILGNITIVLIWHFAGNYKKGHKYLVYIITLITAALAKFLVLYTGIVLIAIPLLLNLPAPQAKVISGMFSVSQLFTALIGGSLAVILFPRLKRAIRQDRE